MSWKNAVYQCANSGQLYTFNLTSSKVHDEVVAAKVQRNTSSLSEGFWIGHYLVKAHLKGT